MSAGPAVCLRVLASLIFCACTDANRDVPTAVSGASLRSIQAQQSTPTGFFEVSARYESVSIASNGTFGVEYCAGTFYGRFGDVPCHISPDVPAGMGSPAMFLSTDASRNVTVPTRNGVLASGVVGSSSATISLATSYAWTNVNFRSAYGGDIWSRNASGTIRVFVLGPPGTHYQLQRAVQRAASAAKTSGVTCFNSGPISISAKDENVSAAASANGTGSQDNYSNSDVLEGATSSETRSLAGVTYSFAGQYTESSLARTVQSLCEDSVTAESKAEGMLTITVTLPASGPSDDDGDGVPNSADLCPGTQPGDGVDLHGCSKPQVDSDGDGVCNPGVSSSWCSGSDNCPLVDNPDQQDSDHDGVGDACTSMGQVTIWVKAFIPRDLPFINFPRTTPAPAPYADGTMLEGPYQALGPFNPKYLTDGRSFAPDPFVSSRMHSLAVIDVPTGKFVGPQAHWADPTVRFDLVPTPPTGVPTLRATCVKRSDTSRMSFSDLHVVAGAIVVVHLDGAASNPCRPLGLPPFGAPPEPPDIDYILTITINPDFHTVSVSGFVDPFPAFEMYAKVGGVTKSLFLRSPALGTSPWNLIGLPNILVSGSVTF